MTNARARLNGFQGKATARRKLKPDVQRLADEHGVKLPNNLDRFASLPRHQQLDFIATRIIAKSRTTTSHREMREEGILSVSQYERRLHREVYSNHGTLAIQTDDMKNGIFGRVHVKKRGERVRAPRYENE